MSSATSERRLTVFFGYFPTREITLQMCPDITVFWDSFDVDVVIGYLDMNLLVHGYLS